MTLRERFYKSILIFLLLLQAGCASIIQNEHTLSPEASKAVLYERITAFMQAEVDKDWKIAYSFFYSLYKESVPQIMFANLPRDKELKAFTIESVDLSSSGNEGTVVIKEDISIRGFVFKGIKKTQKWIRENNQWVLIEVPAEPALTPSE